MVLSISEFAHLSVGYDGYMLIPQIPAGTVVPSLAIMIYPLSPHEAAHEFLTIQ